ncbi:MAG: hypothetical protein CM15mP13_2620 [Pseudomonadota bacterium]|nr:MAG: hypothetical protein CM15mP13_2620 [Pseudomonadota bacterium]
MGQKHQKLIILVRQLLKLTIKFRGNGASILAKVFRDDLMIAFSKKYPDFSLEKIKDIQQKP